MIPEIGQHVKCILRNNTVVEGIVEEWKIGSYAKLKSLDEKSLLIIPRPDEDIMLIKILLQPDFPKLEFVKFKKDEGTEVVVTSIAQPYVDEEKSLERQFQETLKLPSSDPTRLETLAALRKQLNEQEKKIITEKVKNHYIDGSRKVQYGLPGFFKKPSAK